MYSHLQSKGAVMEAEEGYVPDVYWNIERQCVMDVRSNDALPNYSGLCLFKPDGAPHPMVMNTWLEGGARCWDVAAFGPTL